MRIIGITGTLGAGKGTIVDFLVKKHGFAHYSVREYLLQIIREKKMPENRDSMVIVANKLRQDNSPSFIVEQLLVEARQKEQDAIIESIRTPGEVTALREAGKGLFTLLAVDADPKVRYSRVVARKSETDRVTFEKFVSDEQREMSNTEPHQQNLGVVLGMADFTLNNDTDLESLHKQLSALLPKLGLAEGGKGIEATPAADS